MSCGEKAVATKKAALHRKTEPKSTLYLPRELPERACLDGRVLCRCHPCRGYLYRYRVWHMPAWGDETAAAIAQI